MKRLLNTNTIVGILFIVAGILLSLRPAVDADLMKLNIEKPSSNVLHIVKPVSKLITDPTDRAKLAIFNQEFANRVTNYSGDIQQINDVYVLAAGDFFKDSIHDKYKDLDVKLVELFKSVTTEENHKLSQEELTKLSECFMGLSWSLIN